MLKQNSNIKDRIAENEQPFDFKIQFYLEKGFEICNQFAVGFIGFYFLFLLITGTVGNFGSLGEVLNRIFITPILAVGPYFVARQIYQNQPFNFDQFWLGVKNFYPLAIVAAIQTGVFLFFLSPMFFSEKGKLINQWFREWQEDPMAMTNFPEFPTIYLLLLIPIVYLAVAWAYAPLFVIFKDLNPLDALETSHKMVTRKWLIVFGFFIILGIIIFSGILFFGIGILYTLPISACMLYVSWVDWMEHHEGATPEEQDWMKDLMDAF